MEKFDLTKCNNCHFKARIPKCPLDFGDVAELVEGTLSVCGGKAHLCFSRYEFRNWTPGFDLKGHTEWRYIESLSPEYLETQGIYDFEIVPRDPETYKDWQVGDVIWSSDGRAADGRIIFRSGEFVAADIDGCVCYTCQELFDMGYRLVLTDIETRIIEEKKYNPLDGDICYAETSTRTQRFIIIYNCRDWSLEQGVQSDKWRLVKDCTWAYSTIRPATEEEKRMLFDAMAREGKRWNAEKKVVEDIPKPYEFRKGEPVLVRDYEHMGWRIAAYISKDVTGSVLANTGKSTVHWKHCIPYNEKTMHLLGTTEDYREDA